MAYSAPWQQKPSFRNGLVSDGSQIAALDDRMVSVETQQVGTCMRKYAFGQRWVLLSFLLFAACSQSIAGGAGDIANSSPDGGVEPDPISTNDDADAAPVEESVPVDISVRGTTTDTILPLNAVSCNNNSPNFLHTDNRYFRVFDLGVAGVVGDFNVTSIDVGIEKAIGNGGTQNIVVSLQSLTGPIETGTLVQLGVANVPVPDQVETLINVPLSVTIPAGTTLVAEVFTPDGQGIGNSIFLGSNRDTEVGPTYIAAPACGINQPTPIASLGLPGVVMSMVLNVNGQHTPN